jgi:hypothetical protein
LLFEKPSALPKEQLASRSFLIFFLFFFFLWRHVGDVGSGSWFR